MDDLGRCPHGGDEVEPLKLIEIRFRPEDTTILIHWARCTVCGAAGIAHQEVDNQLIMRRISLS